MKPRIIFKCTNKDCKKYAKELELHFSSFIDCIKEGLVDDYRTVMFKYCRYCCNTGEVKIEHGSRKFSDLEAFAEYILGVVKEAKLLKKLANLGFAELEEKEQLENSTELLHEVKCPYCGELLIEKVTSASGVQPPVADDANKART